MPAQRKEAKTPRGFHSLHFVYSIAFPRRTRQEAPANGLVFLASLLFYAFAFTLDGVKAAPPSLRRSASIQCERFNALSTAFTEASSMFVSTAAPQRVRPSACLIWI